MDAVFGAVDVLAACGASAVLGAVTYHVMVAKKRIAAAVRAASSPSPSSSSGDSVRDQDLVREAYHKTVTRNQKREEEAASASEQGCCQVVQGVAGSRIGYSPEDLAAAGTSDTTTMLGCGTPVELANLQRGETVLDLGCGAGVDCLIAARRVGPSGSVIGVDMTPAMLAEARKQAVKAASAGGGGGGLANTSFRLGEIEHLPMADGCVDCIISNCVINLSPDKPQVYAEMFRVLRTGGRIAISDVLREVQELPEHLRTAQALAC
jgi:arsenite methyltransferase